MVSIPPTMTPVTPQIICTDKGHSPVTTGKVHVYCAVGGPYTCMSRGHGPMGTQGVPRRWYRACCAQYHNPGTDPMRKVYY